MASTPTPPGSMLKVSGHSVEYTATANKNPTLNLGVWGFGHRHLEATVQEEHTSRIRTGVAILFPPTVSKFRENVTNHITKFPWIAFLLSFPIRKKNPT